LRVSLHANRNSDAEKKKRCERKFGSSMIFVRNARRESA
jgi:hypothetical protein